MTKIRVRKVGSRKEHGIRILYDWYGVRQSYRERRESERMSALVPKGGDLWGMRNEEEDENENEEGEGEREREWVFRNGNLEIFHLLPKTEGEEFV